LVSLTKERDVKYDKKKKKAAGDVLGLADAAAGPKLPHPPSDGSTPRGIEVRDDKTKRSTGIDDLTPSKVGSGIDTGAGNTDVDSKL
jgi:hypothetical protein